MKDEKQQAYSRSQSWSDKITEWASEHLSGPITVCFSPWGWTGSTVRIMFFGFSSAFNTIQPALLYEKLQKLEVDSSTIAWIIDYLFCNTT